MSSSNLSFRALGLGIWVLGLLACGSSSTDAGARSDGGVTPANVRLTVESAQEASSAGNLSAATGKTFVVVRLTLANELASTVAFSPANFRLRTSDGLEVLAAMAAMQLPDACPSDAFLGAGRSASCSVAFEVSQSVEPDALLYVGAADGQIEPSAIRAGAAVASYLRCDRCNGVCVDLKTSDEHCGACNASSCQRCENGSPTCDAGYTCADGRCIDDSTNSMLRSSTSLVSCDSLCAAEGRECIYLAPGHALIQRPLAIFTDRTGESEALGVGCSDVPPENYIGYDFKEIRCACKISAR